jgi:hypothetical protein
LKYRLPEDWFLYDAGAILKGVTEAQEVAFAFCEMPFEQPWLDGASRCALDAEVEGTCRGRAGGENEVPPDAEAAGVRAAYDWVSSLPGGIPVDEPLILDIHRRLEIHRRLHTSESGSGSFRGKDDQVYFGEPLQRGAKGGRECQEAVRELVLAMDAHGSLHPPLIRGLALHYHLATIHPFGEANGRTARALDSLLRQKAGLAGPHFVPMADFYAEERSAYHASLGAARRSGHDLTPFLEFGLAGLARQCASRFDLLRARVSRALFERRMGDLFGRIRSGKRADMAARQLELLSIVLDAGRLPLDLAYGRLRSGYQRLKNPWKALLRDIGDLAELGALEVLGRGEAPELVPRLSWPREITDAAFLRHYTESQRTEMSLTQEG